MRKFQNGDTACLNEKTPKWILNKFGAGTQVIIDSYTFSGYYRIRVTNSGHRYSIKANGLDKSAPKSTKEQFNDQIKKAEAVIEDKKAYIAEIKLKLAFMDEIGSDVYDENEFKAYQTLSIIEQGDMSKLEKAKAIAALINA